VTARHALVALIVESLTQNQTPLFDSDRRVKFGLIAYGRNHGSMRSIWSGVTPFWKGSSRRRPGMFAAHLLLREQETGTARELLLPKHPLTW